MWEFVGEGEVGMGDAGEGGGGGAQQQAEGADEVSEWMSTGRGEDAG